MVKKDRDLEREIQDLLRNDPHLSVYGLKASVDGGSVSLQGVVDVLEEKIYAEERVKTVPGVRSVENALVLCTDGPIDDEDVAFEVGEELRADPDIPASIGFEVRSGHVRLLGKAEMKAQEEAAIKRARRARGVVGVSSEVQLGHEAVDDATLVNRTQTALNRLGGRAAQGIRVDCEEGVVILSGRVDNAGEIGTVEEAVAHVPGVREIRNRLETNPSLPEELVTGMMERIGADPFLNRAGINYYWENGQFVIDGEVDSVEMKKALEGAVQDLLRACPGKIMVENRIRVSGD